MVIQPTLIQTSNSNVTINKKRVAAYARVSTDTDEQITSYEAQVHYYSSYIHEKSEWKFVEVYADESTPYGQNPKSP
jgi:site-specific DNA recombinase